MNAPSKDKRLILLTGGTGFVGYHTVRQLLNQNYSVRCLVRATSNTSRIPPAVESVVGALEDPISLEQAVADCWGVIHLSALVKARDKAEFYRVNRDGTMNLVEAAHQAGVRRFVYCSSQAAGGPSSLHHIRTPDDEPNPVTDYGRSKLAGEKVLTESAKTMWYCILRPPAVYGPLDTSFLT